jgi:CelD/BcsL family acetyltransferase involved in cellulose biosynthesis
MAIEVQLRGDAGLFASLAAEWSALLHRSAVDTIFLTPQWQQVWWRHFGAGRELRLLLARDDAGTLLGIAPLYALEQAGRQVLQFVGGVNISDYLDFVVAQGREAEVYRAFLEYLLSEAPPWDLLDLHCLPGHSPTRAGILQQVCAACCPEDFSVQPEEAAPYIPLPGDWEAYLETLDRKQRHEVRRKLRRAEAEAEVRWSRLEDPAGLEEAVNNFIRLHRASHPEKDAFMTPPMEAFFRDMAGATMAAGWLNLYTLWLDDRPAATMWCFDYGNDLLVYNSGFDPAWRPELGSGIVLLGNCIQDAIARGKARFDFLRGGEVYKYRFGAVDSAVYHLVVQHPGGHLPCLERNE